MAITNRQAAKQIIENPISYLDLPRDLKNDKHLALLAIQTNTQNIQNTINTLASENKILKDEISVGEHRLSGLNKPENKFTTPSSTFDETEASINLSKYQFNANRELILEATNSTRIFHHLGDKLSSDPEFLKTILDQELMSMLVPTSVRILDSLGYEMNDVRLDSILNELITDNEHLTELVGFNTNLHDTYDQALEIDKSEQLNQRQKESL